MTSSNAKTTWSDPVNLDPDGWTTLHCGGGVLCEGGQPVRVSDGDCEGEAADGSTETRGPCEECDLLDDLRGYGWLVELGEWGGAADEPDATARVTSARHVGRDAAEKHADDVARLARLEWGSTLYRTETQLAGATLYDWLSGGNVLTPEETEAALADPQLDMLRRGWGDPIADYVEARWDAARERCLEIAHELAQ